MAEYQTPEFHPAFEEYCEAIWELKEDDVAVIQARIAERLHVSRPAVSEMIKRMQAEGFVDVAGSVINLTADGRHLAEQVVRRHRLAERLLTDILGLSWAEAINRLLDNPTTCPHGNPIPGSSYAAPDAVALSNVPVGSEFTVTRIPEELEFTPGLLVFLEDAAVQPGRSGVVTATSPDGTMTVEIEGTHVGIGAFASARILVTEGKPAEKPAVPA